MKIAIFARAMGAHRAGAYVWPFEILSREMAARGHRVTAFTTAHPDGGARTTRDAGVEVRYLDGTRPEKVDARFWRASADAFDALHSEARFDVALGRGASAWGLLDRSRFASALPLVSHKGTYPDWLHRIEIGGRPGAGLTVPLRAFAQARRHPSDARCLIRSSRVVCVAPALARAVRRTLWWRPPRTVCIPYGFDLAGFGGDAPPPRPDDPPRLVYVGRLTQAKGAEDLLAILSRLRRTDVRLEAIGPADPAYLARLRDLARQLGVCERLDFAGPLSHDALPQRLRAAAAFVLPSTHPEGLSKAAMEAMAMGLAVVAYALPGFEGLIEDGVDGCLVPPRRTDRAAARLDALLDDPAAAARLGAAARLKIATRFAPEAAARAWDDLLDAVVREHAAAGRRRPERGRRT